MNIPQYLARCAQLGVTPLEHKPPPPVTTDEPNGWWRLLMFVLGLASIYALLGLCAYAARSEHGVYLLCAYVAGAIGMAAYLKALDMRKPKP